MWQDWLYPLGKKWTVKRLKKLHGVFKMQTDMEEEFITKITELELRKKFFVEEIDAETVLKTPLAWESRLESRGVSGE